MSSNFVTARENEMRVLQAIGLVGWLSAKQVARWVWGEGRSHHSARVSADRVLHRLLRQSLLKRRQSSLGTFVYVLTSTGAHHANEGIKIPLFRDGYDLSQLDVGRQGPAVDYLTAQHQAGNTVLGAASIRQAVKGGVIGAKLAGADGLVLDAETGEQRAVLVVRNIHPELIKKAHRIKAAAGGLELLGSVGLLKIFHRQMLREYCPR